jgi:protein-disulfide isomerase
MWKACAIALLTLFVANAPSFAQAAGSAAPANEAQLLKTAESFVRELYAWGPDVQVKLGPLAPSAAAGFYAVPLQVTLGEQTQSGQVFLSKDGKTLLEGDVFDLSVDPFAENRGKLHIEGNPAKGPADASVTLVEFADFECPNCKQLYENLKGIEGKYPQIRVVYKDFPLTSIHPWANTAAVAGRCAFEQSAEGFWKVHDMIFERQDVISPENVWDKLVSFAAEAGLNADTFKACLASPDAQKAVDSNRADGVALGVNSTPTVYLNGRPVVGGSPVAIDRDIAFELAQKDATQKN